MPAHLFNSWHSDEKFDLQLREQASQWFAKLTLIARGAYIWGVNSYLNDFRSQLRNRFSEDSISMSMSDWVQRNTTYRKKPFSFEGYEFQRQILDDMHPNMAVIKCSQIGLTEIQLRKFAAFLTRNTGVSGIFSLPSDEMYKRVSQTRFGPLINSEKVFNLGGDRPIRSMSIYQINNSFGYFTGAKESDATSINSDLNFNDEVDLTDQEMLALFNSRLQGSSYRIKQGFSTPTYEGFGIDALFKASDQHEYLCRCTHCGHHNIPDFTPDFIVIPGLSSDLNDLSEIDANMLPHLDLDMSYVMCEHCHHPLDLRDPSLRSWVPRHPGRRSRGYRVSPFAVPHLPVPYIVEQLVEYRQKDAMRRFYNTVLGKPYNDSNARLTDADLQAVMRSPSSPPSLPSGIMVGIDVGITCHVTMVHLDSVGNPVVFEWRQVLADNLANEVRSLLKTHEIVGGCMDRHPYTPLSNEIRELSDNRIIPVEYANTANAPAITIANDELDNLSHIRANRTTMLDTVATAIRKRRISFIGYHGLDGVLLQHFKDMVRVEKEDLSASWQKLTGNDHFFHSLAQALFAMRVHGALLYRLDADPRENFTVQTFTTPVSNEPQLGMQSRRRSTISLGSLY